MKLLLAPLAFGLTMLSPTPTDTPTRTIDRATVEALFPTALASSDLCASYGAMAAIMTIQLADYGSRDEIVAMLDAYVMIRFEGDDLRLTPEARTFVYDYMHANCES